MIKNDLKLKPADLSEKLKRFWQLSDQKIRLVGSQYDDTKGSPVFTVKGKYTTRGWTEWTQGFQYGSALLQFDATGDMSLFEEARKKILERMAPHISHVGVHDHGFNNVSTYGNILRLMLEDKIPFNQWEKNFCELALKISGAVQAARWTRIRDGGFISSFNGPHSLFVDTIRSVRALTLSHMLGHVLQGEGDIRISLLERALQHIHATANYSVFYGDGRDIYDVRGRTAHECIFNIRDGKFRCTGTQQGYSGFSTWTRGLAWAMCGFAEQLEWIEEADGDEIEIIGSKDGFRELIMKAARATCDYYIENTPADGIPYWDTGAPDLAKMGDYLGKPADPFNSFEPVDSSAAAIAAQGLLRLGNYLILHDEMQAGTTYWETGLQVVSVLLEEPYLGTNPKHHGLLLHSVYHRPNGWDFVPRGSSVPNGESSMWGDYHIREVCLYLQRVINDEPYYRYFNCIG